MAEIYAPSTNEGPQVLANHLPLRDRFLAGDFYAHHSNCYGEWSAYLTGVISASRKAAGALVNWTERHQSVLMNTIGTPAHFPRMANLPPAIPDITFDRGHAFTVAQSW